MARETAKPLLKQVREIAIAALEERRGLVIYSRIDAQEMDQMARKVERDALDNIRAALPEVLDVAELVGVRQRLQRMDEQVTEIDSREDIGERSRGLERDDIIWKAFEEVVYLLGIE